MTPIKYILFVFAIVFSACQQPKEEVKKVVKQETQIKQGKNISNQGFQDILDSANLGGTILIYDSKNDKLYGNDLDKAKIGYLPASTFKIANTMIGLETGKIVDENMVFKWDGVKKAVPIWEKDLVLKDAFQFSCVPCYRELARNIGFQDMNAYLAKLKFGNMQIKEHSVDMFWLAGESTITSFQQIDFLQRFYEKKLPISDRTHQIVKKILLLEEKESYKMSGKTGWAIQDEADNGWFVGYLETGENVYYFSTNVSPKEGFDMNLFAKVRKEMTVAAFQKMELIK